jgi:hypothetical protein
MFLSKPELHELTGYIRPSAQAKWLARADYPFEIGADGYPRVLSACVERRLGGLLSTSPKLTKHRTPNFAALLP